jgi:hypothetical protein
LEGVCYELDTVFLCELIINLVEAGGDQKFLEKIYLNIGYENVMSLE